MARFDEIELTPATAEQAESAPPPESAPAPRFRRLLALLTDLSLFVALALALSPLLPPAWSWQPAAALAGFVLLVSYYYFAVCWLLWGKTVGGAIFGVKVVAADRESMAFRNATLRWAGLLLSLLSGGIGFLLAALPSRLSLADRLSGTLCITSL